MKNHFSLLVIFGVAVSVFCLSPASADDAISKNVEEPLLTQTGAFELEYIFSFRFDKCGDFSTGETLRKAVIAKIESCPLTVEAKENFYKIATEVTNGALSGWMNFFAMHSFSTFRPNKYENCDDPRRKVVEDLIRGKVAQYRVGKIELTDMLVSEVAPHMGEPLSCAELAKGDSKEMLGGL